MEREFIVKQNSVKATSMYTMRITGDRLQFCDNKSQLQYYAKLEAYELHALNMKGYVI